MTMEPELSNTVYHCDISSRRLEKAESYEQRMQRTAAKDGRQDSVLRKLEANKATSAKRETTRHTAVKPKDKKKDPPAR